jgi:hypothetical protein
VRRGCDNTLNDADRIPVFVSIYALVSTKRRLLLMRSVRRPCSRRSQPRKIPAVINLSIVYSQLASTFNTRFVIFSSSGLQQDPADTSAQTLLAISQTLLAISNGQPANSSTLGSPDPATSFTPSHATVTVNILWYLSLSLSVAVSLVAMLAKEWCHSFMSNRSGQIYEQGRRRQERWNGIVRWKMIEVMTFLPMVMHLALRKRQSSLRRGFF